MSMFKKINDLFVNEDEFIEEDYKPQQEERKTEKVDKEKMTRTVNKPTIKQVTPAVKNDVILIEPLVFVDSKDILDNIKKNKVVIINISKLDLETADRILDFISGGIYAMDAKLKVIGEDIYLCVPNGVEVSGSFYEGEQ